MRRWRLLIIVLLSLLSTISCTIAQLTHWMALNPNGDALGTLIQSNPTLGERLQIPPDNCLVTRPSQISFVPPPAYPQNPPVGFWYGTDALWTVIPSDSVWSGLPYTTQGYGQKVLWWRKGYSWTEEPQPQLTVTGRRLDVDAPPLKASRATNAFAADIQSAMLVGVDIPTAGCWEITGSYYDAELSFVVWVAP